MDDIYDPVVIGAGPAGGGGAAELAASFGLRALVVERSQPGGVVATTGGALQKLALREAAVHLTGYRQEEVYGVRAAALGEVADPPRPGRAGA
jgi:pyruvate/2-oxoglutarate dehydrogenase complex dihydrolipoamide dehydrogenase (E3) component